MRRPKYFLGVLFVLIIFASCQSPKLSTQNQRIYVDGSEMVAEAKKVIHEISVVDFKNNYAGKENVYLIDVRTETEFEDGSIAGSVSIPRGVIEFRIGYDDFWNNFGTVPPGNNSPIILYCRSGGRSALAAKTLMQLGYTNVYSLQGGFNAWIVSNS